MPLIRVATLPAGACLLGDETAVVVDVLRATSVIATAITHGAEQVIACREIADAVQIANSISPSPLLSGERHCRPIDGFDLGNSPCDYSSDVVAGRTLVMTTTNGTRALAIASGAQEVYTGSFLNLSALASHLQGRTKIVIICAGTDGQETDEDILFAGALADRLVQRSEYQVDASASLAQARWRAAATDPAGLGEILKRSLGGRNLLAAGYERDVLACALIDGAPCVPTMICRDPIRLSDNQRRER